MSHFAQANFSNLPIALLLLEGGRVAFTVTGPFIAVYDIPKDHETPYAFFEPGFFLIAGQRYEYDSIYACADHPSVVKWLRSQAVMIDFIAQVA